MSTQNVQSASQFRSSGHKEETVEHTTKAALPSKGEGGDLEALLQNRILNLDAVSRAALYDVQDFLCVGSSTARFKIEPDDVRKIYDGVLTAGRQNDPTFANQGEAPKTLSVGSDTRVNVQSYNQDHIAGEVEGKPFIAAPTAQFLLLVEGKTGANVASLKTSVHSFQEGLQALACVAALAFQTNHAMDVQALKNQKRALISHALHTALLSNEADIETVSHMARAIIGGF